MIKFVVDVAQEIVALGGDMHADAEALLLENGSKQSDLWGGNLYPWNAPENRIDYISFINIRPMENNTGMDVQDESCRARISDILQTLVLRPEENMEPLD
ncbi:hypothetical protein EH223_07300 [candidate division KSB1 bacterium]|nr:hypothetical protein [candidate division KSB1 bacterium]RQW04425.1 MAG: hypothetical protein EH223_07300 [candidate division KSB1 bacterium]